MEVNYEVLTDDELVAKEFDELLNDYLSSNHRKKVDIIKKAFFVANEAHKGVKRRSGEPYILHPIAVARIVCRDMGLGSTSICAALLHDVIEDTDYTEEDIAKLFGDKIAMIVSGLTKIAGGIFGKNASAQAENFKRLLLTMSEDIRVILIKIADRLHNMRTLGSMLPNKQYKIAGETLYIYAPLAHRLGLFSIKTELENLSFKYEHPEDYEEIQTKIVESEEKRRELFQTFAAPIKAELDARGFNYEMKARVKSAYSIWNKMQTKNIPFEEVYDLYAVRIIYKPEEPKREEIDCWKIYSIITRNYKLHPDRTRDWVGRPKANGYQAIHTTVMGPEGRWVEVQIRSERMNDVAERGFAAHWKYKEGGNEDQNVESELDRWLATIKEILENPEPNAIDFLDTIKLNLFASEIFVFTPKGDIKTLPKGSTALDFAFSLHTKIGLNAIAAKIHHKLVPLNQVLNSGDQVEILTSSTQKPSADYLQFVNTAKARTKLLYFLRKARKEAVAEGEKMVMDFIGDTDQVKVEEALFNLSKHVDYESVEDLYVKVYQKDIVLDDTLKKHLHDKDQNLLMKYLKMPFGKKDEAKPHGQVEEVAKPVSPHNIDKKATYILKEEDGKRNYTIAACCKPILGDQVLGFVNEDDEVIVHKRSCKNATKLKSSFGYRIISAAWQDHGNKSFIAFIEVKGLDRLGVLNQITQIISGKMNVNIRKINIESEDGLFEGRFSLSVHDVMEVEKLCQELRKIPQVQLAHRISNL